MLKYLPTYGAFVIILSITICSGIKAQTNPVTDVCLSCICEAMSLCDTSLGCKKGQCGPLQITWAYWNDGGQPTLGRQSPDDDDAYSRCANDAACSLKIVQGYMTKFGRDCNGDRVVDCNDYMAIHLNGPFGCSNPLHQEYTKRYNNCMANIPRG